MWRGMVMAGDALKMNAQLGWVQKGGVSHLGCGVVELGCGDAHEVVPADASFDLDEVNVALGNHHAA